MACSREASVTFAPETLSEKRRMVHAADIATSDAVDDKSSYNFA